MDIKTSGLTVRPLTDMAWRQPFNETFFEDVRVPAKNLVGEENRGWYVGMTLLDFERSGISGAISHRRNVRDLMDYAKGEGKDISRLSEYDTIRHEVADRHTETEVLFNFAFRIVSMQNAGMVPNYEASMNKMYGSELAQRVARTGTKVFGLYSNLWKDTEGTKYAPLAARFTHSYCTTVPLTILSGSNEIQRNVIATRGLGLPRG
jgi:alkylation response protein AidB-like acyl-CoA dehydrogenase